MKCISFDLHHFLINNRELESWRPASSFQTCLLSFHHRSQLPSFCSSLIMCLSIVFLLLIPGVKLCHLRHKCLLFSFLAAVPGACPSFKAPPLCHDSCNIACSGAQGSARASNHAQCFVSQFTMLYLFLISYRFPHNCFLFSSVSPDSKKKGNCPRLCPHQLRIHCNSSLYSRALFYSPKSPKYIYFLFSCKMC